MLAIMRSLLPVGLSALGLRIRTAVTFSATCGILLLGCLSYAPALRAQDYSITTAGGNLVVTDNSGNGETLAMSQSGSNIRLVVTPTTRTYSINGGPATAFTTPADIALAGITSITINAEAGNDFINIGAFTDNLPNLTINGGADRDAINFNSDITFATNANLDLDLQNDTPTPGATDDIFVNAKVRLSGTGSAVVRVSRRIIINSNGSFETEHGDLLLEANQQSVAALGHFRGVEVIGGLLKVSGSGSLTVKGRGGDDASPNYGVSVISGGKIEGGAGTVTVVGRGGSDSGFSYGVHVSGAGSQISALGSDLVVTGIAGGRGGSSLQNIGLVLVSGGQLLAVLREK
jgi:mucin-19